MCIRDRFDPAVNIRFGTYLLATCLARYDGDFSTAAAAYHLSLIHILFSALRELDARGAKAVVARCPAQEGVAMAVYNRLLRAAAFRVRCV